MVSPTARDGRVKSALPPGRSQDDLSASVDGACGTWVSCGPFIKSDLRDLALRGSGSRLRHGANARTDGRQP